MSRRAARLRPLRLALLACVAAVGFSGVLAAQESLLPPGFEDKPAPQPTRTAPRPQGPGPGRTIPAPAAAPESSATPDAGSTSIPVVQPVPGAGGGASVPSGGGAVAADSLDDIDPALIDELVEKARPKYDIPPQGRRSLDRVGFLDEADGGFPAVSTHYLNGAFVSGMLAKFRGPLVSRWGHILLRRALASRLDTPVGLNGADWAALRAQVLLRIGEADAARAMVQEVDSGFYTPALEDAAMGSFLATSDPVGLCPITALTAAGRAGNDWDLIRAICTAFTGGEDATAMAQLDRALRRGAGAKVDILLAQKFAGAASNSRRAVRIEWDGVDALTPWRTGMALATGLEPPEALRKAAGADYALIAARAPMLPLAARAQAADIAAARGVLSAAAMVDLYSELHAAEDRDKVYAPLSDALRNAYLAPAAADRLAAIRSLWGDASDADRAYSRLVLTAYAAARLNPDEAFSGDAAALIASMLTAGLDRNAMRWAPVVPTSSEAWALLTLAAPSKLAPVGSSALDGFRTNDDSTGSVRSGFFLAGLMGLGRVDDGTARGFAGTLGIDMGRQTRWTRAIDAAAESDNPALVAMLAGFGMQGDSWSRMTPVHLYHIVSALRRVGLEGEARMIAAEAVSRV